MKRVKLQPAFVLHSKPYRDTSLLVELLTFNHGRINAVARSARGPRSRFRGLLQAFTPMLISWSGSTDLVTLGEAEASGMPYDLKGDALISGFYLNELIVRLLHHHDAHQEIYCAYQQALAKLQHAQKIAVTLRLFEKELLGALGYGFSFSHLEPTSYYQFNPGVGLIKNTTVTSSLSVFYGEHLLAFAAGKLENEEVMSTAKRLMRAALGVLLGDRPIKSRELFL